MSRDLMRPDIMCDRYRYTALTAPKRYTQFGSTMPPGMCRNANREGAVPRP